MSKGWAATEVGGVRAETVGTSRGLVECLGAFPCVVGASTFQASGWVATVSRAIPEVLTIMALRGSGFFVGFYCNLRVEEFG